MACFKTILLILLLINCAFLRRKERVQPKKKYDPMSKLPKHITKEQLCVGCYGLAKELVKNLRGKKREYEVFDGLKEVCDSDFNGYGYSIEQVAEACYAFMDIFDNARIEYIFINRPNDNDCFKRLCYDKTKVCEGMDVETLMKNPAPQQINTDL